MKVIRSLADTWRHDAIPNPIGRGSSFIAFTTIASTCLRASEQLSVDGASMETRRRAMKNEKRLPFS
jgi:hypothetical protein